MAEKLGQDVLLYSHIPPKANLFPSFKGHMPKVPTLDMHSENINIKMVREAEH